MQMQVWFLIGKYCVLDLQVIACLNNIEVADLTPAIIAETISNMASCSESAVLKSVSYLMTEDVIRDIEKKGADKVLAQLRNAGNVQAARTAAGISVKAYFTFMENLMVNAKGVTASRQSQTYMAKAVDETTDFILPVCDSPDGMLIRCCAHE
jgi:hypothetical protein